jgi:predicted O-methyltransferase YrrM
MINWVKNPKGNKDFNEARWVTDEEGDWLFKLIRLYQPAVVFESGTANGYSTTWMAAANPSVIIDHSTGGIRRDWGVLSGALRRGDVIVFHDMNEPPVIRHVDRLTSQEADEHQADVLPELRNSKHYRIRTKRGMEVVVYEEN